MTTTPRYGLYVTEDTDEQITFREWRDRMASSEDSNMIRIDSALAQKAACSRMVNVTLPAAGWRGSTAPFMQDIAVDGLTAGTNGLITLSGDASTEQQTAARKAKIVVAEQTNGTFALKCSGKKPTVDIPAVIIILG